MTGTTKGQALLENAYRLTTPADNRAYYDAFAATYDTDFAQALGWHYPKAIAALYHQRAGAADVPIADIGCGTGHVAEALAVPPGAIDGIDISAEMLAAATAKGLYRRTIRADLTAPLDALGAGYGAVVSAGTFTNGHLGPAQLVPLLDIARPRALFVIGVNKAYFARAGFGPAVDGLLARGRIADLGLIDTRMYDRDGHDHSRDEASVLCFRTA